MQISFRDLCYMIWIKLELVHVIVKKGTVSLNICPKFQKLYQSHKNTHFSFSTHLYVKYQVTHFHPVFKREFQHFVIFVRCCHIWWTWHIFATFFEDKNVSSTIAHHRIDIFYVMSHDEVIRKVSSWATVVDIVSIKNKY